MIQLLFPLIAAIRGGSRLTQGTGGKAKSPLFRTTDGSLKSFPSFILRITPSSYNRKLVDVINRANKATHSAKTETELSKVLDDLGQFSNTIKFNNIVAFTLTGLGGILALLSFLTSDKAFIRTMLPDVWEMMNGIPPEAVSLFSGLPALFLILFNAPLLFCRYGVVNGLSRNLYLKDILIDNNFGEVSIQDPAVHLKPFSQDFIEFSRGNYKRGISEHYTRRSEDLNFDMYRFDYATKHTVGSGKNRRTEITYYVRFGVIFELECPDFLFVNKKDRMFDKSKIDLIYKEDVHTASILLNDNFKVYARSALDFSKFAKPSVIEQIMKKVTAFDKLNIETHKNKVLISFADDDVIHLNRNHGISDIEAFKNEIAQQRVMRKLNELISIIEKMKKFNDKNF